MCALYFTFYTELNNITKYKLVTKWEKADDLGTTSYLVIVDEIIPG